MILTCLLGKSHLLGMSHLFRPFSVLTRTVYKRTSVYTGTGLTEKIYYDFKIKTTLESIFLIWGKINLELLSNRTPCTNTDGSQFYCCPNAGAWRCVIQVRTGSGLKSRSYTYFQNATELSGGGVIQGNLLWLRSSSLAHRVLSGA